MLNEKTPRFGAPFPRHLTVSSRKALAQYPFERSIKEI